MNAISLNRVISTYVENPYPILEISEKILTHNLDLIKKIVGPRVKILIPVKANAYGCGIVEMLPFFQRSEPEYLGVANPYEAFLLRRYGWKGKILNLGGFFEHMASLFFEYNFTPSITDLWQVELLANLGREKNQNLDVHIKLDLGMGRLGILPEDIGILTDLLRKSDFLKVTGIFTHFPSADLPQNSSNSRINENFREIAAGIMDDLGLIRGDVLLHAANSSSILLNQDSHYDMVRPGLSFYGYFSTEAERIRLSGEFPFLPSLKLTAKPISVRKPPRGSTISYGETCTLDREDSTVGVIPLGYADGIPRSLSNRISFNGHPLLGRVTMDQIILGGIRELYESVELLGPNAPSLEHWADLCGTISYEVMTGLGDRIQRKLV